MKMLRTIEMIALALAPWLGASQGPRSFGEDAPFIASPEPPLRVGPGSGGLVLADVDCDGHVDLITQHLLQRNVAVQLGDGRGRFKPAVAGPMALDFPPGAIASADLNDDGIPDLGIANCDGGEESVHIHLGDGGAGFSPAAGSPLIVGTEVEGYKPILRFLDLNGDGKPDLVAANGRRPSIEVFLGDGRGGFGGAKVLKLSGRGQNSFALGDGDGDGHVDLLTASTGGIEGGTGALAMWRGDGAGGFEEGARSVAAPGARVLAWADVNGDRRHDVVLGHDHRDRLSVLLNDGRGRFESAPGAPPEVGWEAFAAAVADVNHDGKPDLLVATVNSRKKPFESAIAALLGDGGGGFVAAPGSPFRSGPGAYNLVSGDLNEDGRIDLVASSFEGDFVTILLGR